MFKDKIKAARLNKNLKQSELAKKLNVKNTTISNWEKGLSKPDLDTIENLCKILDVDANYFCQTHFNNTNFTFEEQEFIRKLRIIDRDGMEMIEFILNKEYHRAMTDSKIIDDIFIPDHYIQCYPRLASCGTGEYLFDNIPSEKIGVDKNCKADFAIGVNGNSMEPTYYDGDTLLIKKQNKVNIGEIGLFIIDGEAYVKELGKNKLISHNSDYSDINFSETMEITCVGKVIGIYKYLS